MGLTLVPRHVEAVWGLLPTFQGNQRNSRFPIPFGCVSIRASAVHLGRSSRNTLLRWLGLFDDQEDRLGILEDHSATTSEPVPRFG